MPPKKRAAAKKKEVKKEVLLETDARGIPAIETFGCPTCNKHMERGGWFSVECGECGMAIFFKTAAAGKAYREEKIYD